MTISLSALTPGAGGGAGIDFQEFTSNGTWTKPDDVTWVEVEVVGGGGGGGSGAKNAFKLTGGAGGWGSPIIRRIFAASSLGATEAVTIGAGGTGGASVTTNATSGNDGTDGGVSSFGSHLSSGAGTRGKGGNHLDVNNYTYDNSNPFIANSINFGLMGMGGSSSRNGGVANKTISSSYGWCGGGGAGAGIYINAFDPGGHGGFSSFDTSTPLGGSTEGANGESVVAGGLSGAGGGANSKTGNAGNGGNGSIGGGGGGGGASVNDVGDSGAGGNGGSGRIRVWAW